MHVYEGMLLNAANSIQFCLIDSFLSLIQEARNKLSYVLKKHGREHAKDPTSEEASNMLVHTERTTRKSGC